MAAAVASRQNLGMSAELAVEHEDGVGANAATLIGRWLDALLQVTGFDAAYWTVVDLEEGKQQVLVSRSRGTLAIPEGLAVPWRETLCSRACALSARLHHDIAKTMPDAQAALALGIRGYAMAPIEIGGKLQGTLCLASAKPKRLAAAAPLLEASARMVAGLLARDRELAALRHRERELTKAALLDPLTGLANRRALFAALAARLAMGPVRLGFVDLDGFKAINDRFGHAVGDRFLVEVARRLERAPGEGLLAARYAGDEFALLADPDADLSLAEWRERIAKSLQGRYEIDAIAMDYEGASVGAVESEPGDTPERLLARADAEMYRLKRRHPG